MTKSAKHKKLRKCEFQKLKLKVGKKLKKPLNETKTDFKSRKILIKEQLNAQCASSDSFTKKRNVSIKALVGKLTHHSIPVRRDLLKGIVDLIKSNSKDTLAPDASIIVNNAIPLILDVDPIIRHTTVKIVDLLLAKLGSLMNPYLLPLSSHLSCAMVHLNIDVQADSLNLMKSLLTHVPSHVARKANELLENFLSLLTRKVQSKSEKSIEKNDNLTSLNFNPSSSLASIKWRIKLLDSLSLYLGAILKNKCNVLKFQPDSLGELVILACSPCLSNPTSNSYDEHLEILTDENKSYRFTSAVILLLLEIWAEVDSGSHYSLHGNLLSLVAINALSSISQIIRYVWEIIEIVTGNDPVHCKWFITTVKQKLLSSVLVGFPYSTHSVSVEYDNPESERNHNGIHSSKLHLDRNLNFEYQCKKLNISLASIALLIQKEDLNLQSKIIVYCNEIMLEDALSPCLHDAVKISSSLLPSCNLSFGKKILESSLASFRKSEQLLKDLIIIPLQATNWECRELWHCDALSTWFDTLLDEFAKNSHNKFLSVAILQFKLKNTPGFLNKFNKMNIALKIGSKD